MAGRILTITIDYGSYDATLAEAFEAALATAGESAGFTYQGGRRFSKTLPITEEVDASYRGWLSIVSQVHTDVAPSLMVYSSYTFFESFTPVP